MKKILVTESQYYRIKRHLIETGLRSYVFDWDDNILIMPTKIKMDKKEGSNWVPVEVSTEEFAHLRSNPDYRIRNNNTTEAFVDFRDDSVFLKDVEYAIHHDNFAPSYQKFIEALIYANNFAINTARGHSPKALKEGVKLFIRMVMTQDEKNTMIENIKKELPGNLTKGLNNEQLLDLYLDERGEYYPVSSKEFMERFGIEGGAANPEVSKQMAIEHFVKKLLKGIKKYLIDGTYTKISVGFSDDDVKNVKAVQKFIEEELKALYPEVHFVIYDTSEGGKRKMVVKKD